jgi:hypothetical protein
MSPAEFKSLTTQPIALSPLLQAMWHDYHGNWEASHNIAQEINDRDGSWVHAYLHRKEGDSSNASYWYRKAGKSMPNTTLEKEWEEIVQSLLKDK